MQVQVDVTTAIAFGTPALLLKGAGYFAGSDVGGGSPGRTYDISPDGRRFLVIKQPESVTENREPPRLIVVQHWDQELKRLVPAN